MSFLRKQPVLIQIKAQIAWQAARDPQTGVWIAACPALNLNAVGDEWTDLQECAAEAMSLLLQDLFEDGELQAFLYENGWRLGSALPDPGSRVRFDVPFSVNQGSMAELMPA